MLLDLYQLGIVHPYRCLDHLICVHCLHFSFISADINIFGGNAQVTPPAFCYQKKKTEFPHLLTMLGGISPGLDQQDFFLLAQFNLEINCTARYGISFALGVSVGVNVGVGVIAVVVVGLVVVVFVVGVVVVVAAVLVFVIVFSPGCGCRLLLLLLWSFLLWWFLRLLL